MTTHQHQHTYLPTSTYLPISIYLPTILHQHTYLPMYTSQNITTHVNLPSSTYLPLPIPKYQYIIAADSGAGIGLVFNINLIRHSLILLTEPFPRPSDIRGNVSNRIALVEVKSDSQIKIRLIEPTEIDIDQKHSYYVT